VSVISAKDFNTNIRYNDIVKKKKEKETHYERRFNPAEAVRYLTLLHPVIILFTSPQHTKCRLILCYGRSPLLEMVFLSTFTILLLLLLLYYILLLCLYRIAPLRRGGPIYSVFSEPLHHATVWI